MLLPTLDSEHALGCSDVGDDPAPVKVPKHVVRKYDHERIKFGFILAGNDAETKAKCHECRPIFFLLFL